MSSPLITVPTTWPRSCGAASEEASGTTICATTDSAPTATSAAASTGKAGAAAQGVIGLFGLAGLAGAVIAPLSGRWADRGHGRLVQTAFLAAVPAGWALLALGGHSLAALLAGIVVLDLGVQGAHIGNQSTIYALRPEARSRLTTAYMVSVFVGAVGGSALAATVHAAAGWGAVCGVGAAVAATALAVWAATRRLGRAVPETA